MLAHAIAAAALLALGAYAVLGGADFGGGVLDLLARGPRRDEQRAAIAHAMGPVWEANHVWLIFVLVVLFTAFPSAFAALSISLFAPFHLVLLGITLRGAAFVFRAHLPRLDAGQARWGVVFGVASAITPVLLGACLGAIATGSIRVEGDVVRTEGLPWLRPLSIAIGALALAVCAWLAAVFLVNETEGELREDFRRSARITGIAAVVLSAVTFVVLRLDAPHLFEALLRPRSAPLHLGGLGCAAVAAWALQRGRFREARMASVALAVLWLAGFWAAQFPYIIYPDVTVDGAAAPEPVLLFLAFSLPLGAALILPSLAVLLRVFKREALAQESG